MLSLLADLFLGRRLAVGHVSLLLLNLVVELLGLGLGLPFLERGSIYCKYLPLLLRHSVFSIRHR